MILRSASAAVVLAALALVAAGCGDDDDEATDVTKAEYAESVRTRCGEYLKERREAEKPLGTLFRQYEEPDDVPTDELQEGADEVAALNDTTRQVIADLEELPRPEAEEETLDEVFENLNDAVASLDDADEAAEEGDGAALGRAYESFEEALGRNSEEVSEEFGFSVCGGR